ncbi:MAG: hypothetical protein II135_09545 [Clostridia bacterium]|nr:hypothetical protein [Clostridia bacterium]
MKKNFDLESAEKWAEKSFSGIEKNIVCDRMPDIKECTVKNKKTRYTDERSPLLQVAGVFAAAVLVMGLTFGALRYLEHVAGQHTPAVTEVTDVKTDTASSETEPKDRSIDNESIKKAHVYFMNPDHYNIDSEDALRQALKDICDYCAHDDIDDTLLLTIAFSGNYFSSDEYNDLLNNRGGSDDAELLREFRAMSNTASKEYHHALVELGKSTLPAFNYNDCSEVEYSPYVVYSVNYTEVTYDLIADLILNGSVSLVTVSLPIVLTSC